MGSMKNSNHREVFFYVPRIFSRMARKWGQHFLIRQGVVERMLSDRSCVLRYVRQDKVFTCERSIQGLALITKASRLEKIMEDDIIIDSIFVQ